MNQIAPLKAEGFVGSASPLKLATMAKERAAFRSLALMQRRLSWVARKRALEAEASGNLSDYRHYAAEARRLWRDALEHISYARMRSV